MSDVDQIITDIIRREGGSTMTNDPSDKGGRTQYGIAEKSNPQAWADGKVTEAEARAIYERKYVKPFAGITHPDLLAQLVDWGVTSGPVLVAQKLQQLVGAEVDGQIGPQTLTLVNNFDPRTLTNQLVAERVRMIGRIVKRDPSQLKYLNGWLERALSFIR